MALLGKFKSSLREGIGNDNTTQEFKKLAVLISTSNDISGQFLQAYPKGKGFKFSSLEFQTALNGRLFSLQILYPENTRCTCANHPILDRQGIHLTTQCGKDGFRHRNHNAIVDFLKESLNQKQIKTVTKKLNLYRNVAADEKRPDLLVVNPKGADRSCLLDVRVTHPLTGRTRLSDAHQAMNLSFDEKNSKYAAISNQCGYDFLPFIVSSTGQIDERSLAWYEKQVKGHLAEDGICSKKELEKRMSFWTKRFSCLIQKCLARSMIQRSKLVFYEQNVIANHEISREFIDAYSRAV